MPFYAGPRLLILDEVGYLPLTSEAAAALFLSGTWSGGVTRAHTDGHLDAIADLAAGLLLSQADVQRALCSPAGKKGTRVAAGHIGGRGQGAL